MPFIMTITHNARNLVGTGWDRETKLTQSPCNPVLQPYQDASSLGAVQHLTLFYCLLRDGPIVGNCQPFIPVHASLPLLSTNAALLGNGETALSKTGAFSVFERYWGSSHAVSPLSPLSPNSQRLEGEEMNTGCFPVPNSSSHSSSC
jgi:hypothetical protein